MNVCVAALFSDAGTSLGSRVHSVCVANSFSLSRCAAPGLSRVAMTSAYSRRVAPGPPHRGRVPQHQGVSRQATASEPRARRCLRRPWPRRIGSSKDLVGAVGVHLARWRPVWSPVLRHSSISSLCCRVSSSFAQRSESSTLLTAASAFLARWCSSADQFSGVPAVNEWLNPSRSLRKVSCRVHNLFLVTFCRCCCGSKVSAWQRRIIVARCAGPSCRIAGPRCLCRRRTSLTSSSWRVAPGCCVRTASPKAFASQTASHSWRVAPGPPHRGRVPQLMSEPRARRHLRCKRPHIHGTSRQVPRGMGVLHHHHALEMGAASEPRARRCLCCKQPLIHVPASRACTQERVTLPLSFILEPLVIACVLTDPQVANVSDGTRLCAFHIKSAWASLSQQTHRHRRILLFSRTLLVITAPLLALYPFRF